MKAFIRRSVLVLLVVLVSNGVHAQWRNVAPGLVQGTGFFGAMQFRDGVIWAGGGPLWSSTDYGVTWQRSKSFPNREIKDIVFFDRHTGLVATTNGVLRTSDGGLTWKATLPSGEYWKVSFGTNASQAFALDVGGFMYASGDGGATWSTYNIANRNCRSFSAAPDGTIYVDASDERTSPYAAQIYRSIDLGKTWTAMSGTVDGDCYTIATDSCDAKRLYLVNEEVYDPSDSIAQFYLSMDGGASWQTTFSHHSLFFSGALTTTRAALFLGTLNNRTEGTYRSTDRGATWNSIGGPSTGPDTRNLAAVDANTVFAMDDLGSIWMTANGGGDSVSTLGPFIGSVTLSADTLFAGDTLTCNSSVAPIYVSESGCNPPMPSGYRITGPDSASFRIAGYNDDSIAVESVPAHSGDLHAEMVVTLADGSADTIALLGFGASPRALSFGVTSDTVSTDTIGDTVRVPITLNGLLSPQDIELTLHYPLADLEYLGSYDRSGNRLDLPGDSGLGRSKLFVVSDTPGRVAAYAWFLVFSDTNYDPQVTFDSVTVPNVAAPCEYLPPPRATATIVPLSGCGTQMLSQWIHLRKEPVLTVRPNPTRGEVRIESSEDLGTAAIEVCDMLGVQRAAFEVSVAGHVPISLSLDLPPGAYDLHVRSNSIVKNIPVLVQY